jgi:hypothetical protein
MKKREAIALLIMIVLSMSSCQRSEDRYLKRHVAAGELAGSWETTPFAMKCLKETGHSQYLNISDHSLQIRLDGTCRIKSVLNIALFNPNEDPHYVDGECTWSIKNDGHEYLDIKMKPEDSYYGKYYFDQEDGQLVLWQYATDPDLWKYMEFKKRKVF